MTVFIKRQPHWAIAIFAILIVTIYWSLWATDRYVSKATVVLESPQITSTEVSFSSMLSGGGADKDLLLLREYLLSTDMLKIIDNKLGFRQHYSEHGDFFSTLSDVDAPIEELHDYYLSRLHVEMDDYAGVLNVEVQAYTPEFAHRMTQLLLDEGEAHMNDMGRRMADEQVTFLEEQLGRLELRLDDTRDDLLKFQNKEGLISPISTVESINQVVATLEGQLATLQAQRKALASYQSARSSDMKRVTSEIEAMREQILQQRDRLAQATGNSLNKVSSQYQSLELKAKFAQETYSGAIAALESTRIEAARKLKKVSILQSPLMPEYSTEPKRIYNITVFALITIFLAFIASMLILIIKEHRD
ncbi:chain-length determining protein [Cobetia marina]|uniref:chain-length determining protein n=1 Tax=Cobetia marina TaxID=28258 RepID=UPI0010AED197|nr:chain-length determining protein [Cobetia marina]TKD61465.1 chain-length determining protein [Cobetia marina]